MVIICGDWYYIKTMKKTIFLFLIVSNLFAKNWFDENNFQHLLHYQDGKSLVLNDDFFLSPEGKTNLNAEILALKESYYLPESLGDNHPRCKFPDRYFWLSKQTQLIDYEVIPKFCNKLTEWHQEQETTSISALLIGGYFSNPASVFGHNLLKLNTKEKSLFDESINFGANIPPNENSIVYIFKGLFGGYKAKFNNREFYARDLVYAKNELRDIWEYELNLTTDEILLIKLHIWSLNNKEFTYYFLKENCAYQLASIINIVEDMELPQHTPWYIPVEFVNTLVEKNLVKQVKYQTSSEKALFDKFAKLTLDELGLLENIINNNITTTDIKLLDLALDYYNYILIDNDDKKLKNTKNNILVKRFALPASKSEYTDTRTQHTQLNPQKIEFSAHKNNGYISFSIFNNDLFSNNEEVELVAPQLTLQVSKNNQVKFNQLDIARILKLNKHLTHFPHQQLSWNINFGIKNIDDTIKPHLKAGIGKVLYSNDNLIFWSMADILINQNSDDFSTEASANVLYKNNVANILLNYHKNLENDEEDLYYKIQKPITSDIELFIDNQDDKVRFGMGLRF